MESFGGRLYMVRIWVDRLYIAKGTFLRKRHGSQKSSLIFNSEKIFNLTSSVKSLYPSNLYG